MMAAVAFPLTETFVSFIRVGGGGKVVDVISSLFAISLSLTIDVGGISLETLVSFVLVR